jgi:hypothetical protein
MICRADGVATKSSLPLQGNVVNLNEWLLRGTTSSVSDETMQAFFVKSTFP